MKYRIDIWQYGNIADSYESDNIEEVVNWYKENWVDAYEYGLCSMDVYEQRRDIPFEEAVKLGFF